MWKKGTSLWFRIQAKRPQPQMGKTIEIDKTLHHLFIHYAHYVMPRKQWQANGQHFEHINPTTNLLILIGLILLGHKFCTTFFSTKNLSPIYLESVQNAWLPMLSKFDRSFSLQFLYIPIAFVGYKTCSDAIITNIAAENSNYWLWLL